jgi:uncharacterized protein YccT (UPF0319 family)
MNRSKVNSVSIFVNVSSPFSVLNGLCTGVAEMQVIVIEECFKTWMVEDIELLSIDDIKFSGNEVKFPTYSEQRDWMKQIDSIFRCHPTIREAIYEEAKKNIDLSKVEYMLSHGDKIFFR